MEEIYVKFLFELLSKDLETYHHSLRVGNMANIFADQLNFSNEQKQKLIIGCCLHDCGKILISNEVLNKEGSLTPKEWEVMKCHPIMGMRLLLAEGDIDEEIIDIVKFHHERLDGLGYPFGMKGEEIPIHARICTIIDAYDSMLSNRAYRKGISPLKAREELLKHCTTQFDEFYVREFLSIPEHLLETREIGCELKDYYSINTLQTRG
ncbi:HD-GYP domain-containing protein [Gordoniibacillus kamchatkensis]|uniref:HD-GYP domain-containing protein n=1 Tax=Gordoniibacillus kamchatkensis TaxID=1590651 RepID=UPI0006987BBB|nr:HD-GYP domain-containing protein [Paenibacillus sp. VKM B-2647]